MMDYALEYDRMVEQSNKQQELIERQHEAIRVLREALEVVSDGDIYLPPITRSIVLDALKDTEGL